MSGESTIYDVKVRYGLDDKASSGLKNIANEADKAHKSTLGLNAAFLALGGWATLRAGKKYLVDYNTEIEGMRIGLTTVLQMQLKKPFAEARAEADALFLRLQEIAKKSPATTKDFITMANMLAPAVAGAGGDVKKLESLTTGTVMLANAMPSLGGPEVAARDVMAMLQGRVTSRDVYARNLMSPLGYTDSESWNELDAGKRATLTEQALNAPALKQAAEEFGNSFQGQLSTLQDQLEITFGEVGMPLVKAITGEVKKWNTWIEKNPEKIAHFVKSFGAILKDGFYFLRDVAAFLVDHKDLLMAIAKTFLVFKGTQLFTGAFGALAGGIGNVFTGLKTAVSGITGVLSGETGLAGGFKGLIKVLSGAGGVIPVLGLLSGAAFELFDYFANEGERRRKERGDVIQEAVAERYKDLTRLKDLEAAREKKWNSIAASPGETATILKDDKEYQRIITEQANIKARLDSKETWKDDAAMLRRLTELNPGVAGIIGEGFSTMDYQKLLEMQEGGNNPWNLPQEVATQLIPVLTDLYARRSSWELEEIHRLAYPERYPTLSSVPATAGDQGTWSPPGPEKADINVTIQKIEVSSPDPDRFVFQMVDTLEEVSKNPTQAASVISGGM